MFSISSTIKSNITLQVESKLKYVLFPQKSICLEQLITFSKTKLLVPSTNNVMPILSCQSELIVTVLIVKKK